MPLTEEKGCGAGDPIKMVVLSSGFLWLGGGWMEPSWKRGPGLCSPNLFIPAQMDLKFPLALHSKGLSSLKKEGETLNLLLTF